MEQRMEVLAQKIQTLTPAQMLQVKHLIESLQDEGQRQAAASLSEASFATVWNHPDNDAYDDL